MGDDPRWSLQWLEEELLEEEEEWEEEDETEEEEEIPDRRFFARPRKNTAVDFQRTVYDDEEDVSGRAWLVETRKERKARLKAEKAERKRRSIKGLTFLACLELLGILVIIGWWLRWLI